MKAAKDAPLARSAAKSGSLDENFGVELFRRLNGALQLTEAASACLPKSGEELDRLLEAIERRKGA